MSYYQNFSVWTSNFNASRFKLKTRISCFFSCLFSAVLLSGVNCLAAGTVSPTSLSWYKVAIGNAGGPKSVTLTNTGTVAISISSISISGTNSSDFSIYTKSCGASLGASLSCTATILFRPLATGTLTATLTFKDGAGTQNVPLTGLGTTAAVAANPSDLSFGSVTVGSAGSSVNTTLTNGVTSTLSISSIAISGANSGDFTISSKTCAASLGAGASCKVTVLFKPAATGTRTAYLVFKDSASSGSQTVSLSGTGTSSGTGATVSPSSLAWGSVAVGSSGGTKLVTLTNKGAGSIGISSIAISGTNSGDFSISSKTCGSSLAASASCTATVLFKPPAAGTRTATLAFTDTSSTNPQKVSLTGTGTSGITISPQNPTVAVNGAVQFSANLTTSWTATWTVGSATGLFKAPASATFCKVTATAGSQSVSTTVTVTSSSGQVVITPSTAAVHAIGTTQFTANVTVNWSTSCGSISAAGLYTAPVTAGTCTITAKSTSNASNSDTATVAVSVVNYTSRKNGITETGLQSNELTLTPTSISSGNFVQQWNAAVDGTVWGQPLYMNGITVGGKARNVLYVTTSNDSVYAFDADSGAQLWKTSFLSEGVTAAPGSSLGISTQMGVLSTPVIDPNNQTLYVVAETSENAASYFPHRLHALNIATGREVSGSPVLISDSDLEPVHKFQRPALLLANGQIYIGFGSIEDITPYTGLLFAFDENTLKQVALFNVGATKGQGGLWMSGEEPVADSAGDIYISTANGPADGLQNFGESIVKLSPSLEPLDFFTPYNYATYDAGDIDLGSGDAMLVPDQNGPYPHELIACGKMTPIYVINRDAMGDLGTTSDKVIQRLDNQIGGTGGRDSGQPCYGSPAMWQQNVYFAANNDVLKMFVLNGSTGMLSTTPASKGTYTYAWPGSDPVVSSNGNTNGIVWTVDSATGTLHANDATNVSTVLYTSPSLGTTTRWIPPTVVNGHVYIALSGKVIAYGLK